MNDGRPHIGPEKRSRDVGIISVEKRGGERLELLGLLGRKVNHLAAIGQYTRYPST